jgi:hypothetical protein
MAARIIATVEDVKMGAALALAVVEIDELVPIRLDSALLYYRRVSVEPIEPEWEVEII